MPTLKIEINISLSGKGKDMIETREAFVNGELVYKESSFPMFRVINNSDPISVVKDYLTGNARKESGNRIGYIKYIFNSIEIRLAKFLFQLKKFRI